MATVNRRIPSRSPVRTSQTCGSPCDVCRMACSGLKQHTCLSWASTICSPKAPSRFSAFLSTKLNRTADHPARREIWLLQSRFMFTGIEHFAIASPNPKRLADWYVTYLEFKISYEYAGNYFVEA